LFRREEWNTDFLYEDHTPLFIFEFGGSIKANNLARLPFGRTRSHLPCTIVLSHFSFLYNRSPRTSWM